METHVTSNGSTRRGRLTPAEKDRIAELAARGLKPGQIAQKRNRLPATVNFHMTTYGLCVMSERIMPAYTRNGVEVRPFAPDEDSFIEQLRTEGLRVSEIITLAADKFGYRRTATTIATRLRMLATRDSD